MDEPPKPKQSRFKPVARKRLVPKNVVIKSEVKEEPDVAKEMLERFNKKLDEKKNVKFERKVESTTSGEPYTASRIIYNRFQDSSYIRTQKTEEKDYIEPWDYDSNYPVELPLRRPYSGDPVLLNKEEFGVTKELDENSSSAANDLGLTVEQEEPTNLFLQMPIIMPVKRQTGTTEEANDGSKPQRPLHPRQNLCRFNELPAGHMGKMLVYKNGDVKFKLGDVLFNVSSGLDCVFGQDAVVINTANKDYCPVVEINKRGVLTPDLDSIIDIFQDATI
ncbi:hypothetical protein QQ045_005257 [Rhodiola kirilowii]